MSRSVNQYLLGVTLAFVLVMANCFAAKIEESIFVYSKDRKLLQSIAQNPEFTVDHPNALGFELYGPKGTKQWLDQLDVDYSELDHQDHHKDALDDEAGYPTFEMLTQALKTIAAQYPKITKLFSIGKSVQGRELWVLKISDNVNEDEVEPEFKYISSMHGDEITGRELTTFLIRDLVEAYGKDPEITNLIDNTELFIMPSMNPDGSHLKQRANANGYDLNRNFPDWTRNDANSTAGKQIETMAIMKFQAQRHFSLSANFHGGAVVVNYPWDSSYNLHPFDGLIKNLSLDYADLNPAMRNSTEFSRGITNGAAWYVLYGGMQDWSYYWHNDLQVTVELSDAKWPRYSEIPSFYQDNKDSMIAYAKKIHQGAGFKFDSKRSGSVEIFAGNKSLGTYGFFDGEFYKVLDEGSYSFVVKSEDKVFNLSVNVDDTINSNGNYTLIQ